MMKMKLNSCKTFLWLWLAAGTTTATTTATSNAAARQLAIGDFAEFNQLFDNAVIDLSADGPFRVQERVGIANLDLIISNLKCFDLNVGDILLSHTSTSTTTTQVRLQVQQLDLTCTMNYEYDYGILKGDGFLQVETDNSQATTIMSFDPAAAVATINQCAADIQISKLDFQGDFVSGIIEIFQRLIRGVMERELEQVACSELGSIGTTLVQSVLEETRVNFLDPYIGLDIPTPLEVQAQATIPTSSLDWTNTSNSPVAQFLAQVLEPLNSFLSSGDVLNLFLRDSSFLNDQGALVIDPTTQLDLADGNILLQAHDRMLETKISLLGLELMGLDAMTNIQALQVQASQTLQTSWTWPQLTAQAKLLVEMKPSSLEDAILQDFTSPGIQEEITLTLAVQDLQVVASLLVLLEEDRLGNLVLGSLLDTQDIWNCLGSVLQDLELTGLAVDFGEVLEPQLDGFVSEGLDRLLGDVSMAAFDMYEPTLRQVLPGLLGTSVLEWINQGILSPWVDTMTTADSECPTPANQDGLVSFPNLFTEEDGVYGDLPALLKTMLDTQLLETEADGRTLKMNQALLEPLTKGQSGIAGQLDLVDSIWDMEYAPLGLQVAGTHLHLTHLDSLVTPVQILDTDESQPSLLNNQVTFANTNVANDATTLDEEDSMMMRVHLKALWALQSRDDIAALASTYNEMDLSMNLGGSQWILNLLAPMVANSFLQFPLVDTTNLNCWLATLENTDVMSLRLDGFAMEVPSLDLQVACTNCTSVGLRTALPEVLNLLQDSKTILETRLVDLGVDWVRSEALEEYLSQMVQEAKTRCPHNPLYSPTTLVVEETQADATTELVLSGMSYSSLETLAFGATMALQMATAVLGESFATYPGATSDPLSAQASWEESDDSTGTSLVDLNSLNDKLVDWIGMSMDDIAEYLTARDEETGSLRINSLLQSSLLNADGALEIDVSDMSLGGGETEIALKHIRVTGLDSIDQVEVLDILGPQTMRNQIRFDNLAVEVVVSLLGVEGGSSKTTNDITFALDFSNVDLSATLFAAMDLDLLGSIQMSSILDMKNILPCLLSGARAAELTQLSVNVGSLDKWSVSGFSDVSLTQASDLSADMIMTQYGNKIVAAMPAIFDETVRVLVNNWLSHMVEDWSTGACPTSSFQLNSISSFVDLRDLLLTASKALTLGGSGTSPYGNLFRSIASFLKGSVLDVDETTGLSSVNDLLIAPWTRGQSSETGSLVFPGELLSGGTRLKVGGLDTTVALSASDARIDNLDTIGSPLNLLEATLDPYMLNNTAGIGVADRPVHFAARFLVALSGDDDIEVRNEFDLSLDMSSLSVMLKAMMTIAESSFYNFPLRDVLDLNCWLALLPAPALDSQGVRFSSVEPSAALVELAASVNQMNINLTCIECSSPKMGLLSSTISAPQSQEGITSAVNDMLNYIGDLAGGNFAQTTIDRMLNDAARQCPHSPLYDAQYTAATYKPFEAPDSEFDMSYLIMLGALAIAFILGVALVVYAVRFIVRRRHKKWLGNLAPTTIRSIARKQSKERQEESQLNSATQSMFTSSEIPRFVRWGMPLIILANVAFFLSGHLSLGATVNIEANIAGEKLKVEKFFEFSMARSTVDIWNAGGKELAMMILIFSGIWPYTKQFMTLVLWFMSPARVSVSRRGSILLWLDWLAKWSMVDVFVLVISIAAFRVAISSPDVSFLPEGFYSLDMMVVPLWGLYANMIAQLISQVSSHFIIYYHRKIVAAAKKAKQNTAAIPSVAARVIDTENPKGDASSHQVEVSVDGEQTVMDQTQQQEALCRHEFSRPHRGETEKLVTRKGVNALYCCGIITMAVLVVIGCSIPSFSLEFLGIVGVAVEFGQDFEDANTQHSIFSVLRLLMDEARFLDTASDTLGLLSLCVLLLTTVLFVPIVQSIALARQWFFPATHQKRVRMEVLIETLHAWQYAEVYLLAVFVASWQLGPISQYMINAYCDNLKDTFAQAVHYGILREEDAQCFAVESSIESGFFWLTGGAIILAVLNSFTTKAVQQYFRDRNPAVKSFRADASETDLTNVDSSEDGDEEASTTQDGVGFTARIRPVPVLFTDTFRWLLKADPSSGGFPSSSRELVGGDMGGELPEAEAVVYDQDLDVGMLPSGEYVMNKSMDKQVESLSPKQIAARHVASSAQRKLNFDDSVSARQPSVMDSVSSASASDDWRSTTSSSLPSMVGRRGEAKRTANLKDDATYATPPGSRLPGSRLKSPPSMKTPTISNSNASAAGSASLAYSIATSANASHGSSRRVPRESFVEEHARDGTLSVDESHTLEELLNEDGEDAESGSYYEETVVDETITTNPNDMYDEFTLQTEDDVYEDMSQYTEERSRRGLV